MVKLTPGEEFYGTLHEGQFSFVMFMIDPPAGQTTHISFSNCVGMSMIKLLKKNGTGEDFNMQNAVNVDMLNYGGK